MHRCPAATQECVHAAFSRSSPTSHLPGVLPRRRSGHATQVKRHDCASEAMASAEATPSGPMADVAAPRSGQSQSVHAVAFVGHSVSARPVQVPSRLRVAPLPARCTGRMPALPGLLGRRPSGVPGSHKRGGGRSAEEACVTRPAPSRNVACAPAPPRLRRPHRSGRLCHGDESKRH